jgi:LPXTG-motif cell wall-anchored protein
VSKLLPTRSLGGSPVSRTVRTVVTVLTLAVAVLLLPAVAGADPYGGVQPGTEPQPPQIDTGSETREQVLPASASRATRDPRNRASGKLAVTGTDVAGMIAIGGVALIGGTALVVLSRRRRASVEA